MRPKGAAVWSLLLLIMGGCAGNKPAPAPHPGMATGQDLDYRCEVALTLAQHGGKPRLTSRTRIQATYLSRRATDDTTYYVAEPYFATVEELTATLDGKALPAEHIVKILPDRQDVFLDDTYLHRVRFKRVRAGQTIAYSYKQTFTALAYAPFFTIPNLDRVEQYTVTVNHPRDVRVNFEVAAGRATLNPKIKRTPTRTSVTVSTAGRSLALDYFPFNRFAGAIWPIFSRQGAPLLPSNPARFTSWYLGQLKEPPPFASDQQKKIAALTGDGAATPELKLKALYDFVRQQVRYLADERSLGGIVPRPPSLVFTRKYGDCKDKAYLLAHMARRLNIPVELVLVGNGEAPRFAGLHLWRFNHMIAAWGTGPERVFMDPTCTHCPFRSLPEGDVGKLGLVLHPSSPERVTLPAPPRRPSLTLELSAEATGLAQARADLTIRGSLLRRLKTLRKSASPQSVSDRMATRLSRLLYNIALSGLEVVSVADGEARLRAKADLTRFVTRTDTRLYLPRVPFRVLESDLLERAKDELPIYLESRPFLEMKLSLTAPGFAPGKASAVTMGAAALARFEAAYQPAGQAHQLTYRFQQQAKHFTGQEKTAFLSFASAYLQGRQRMFGLRRVER